MNTSYKELMRISNYGIKLLPTAKFLDNSKYAVWTIANYIATIILAIVFRNNLPDEITEIKYVQTRTKTKTYKVDANDRCTIL
ncbi:hypothetical protein NEAUS03_1048 [Nematocida ausubeli]|nr:hypothetical protein NEAUS03_1048 [Nematocida ausubeli]